MTSRPGSTLTPVQRILREEQAWARAVLSLHLTLLSYVRHPTGIPTCIRLCGSKEQCRMRCPVPPLSGQADEDLQGGEEDLTGSL
jgi:hypothetical protein